MSGRLVSRRFVVASAAGAALGQTAAPLMAGLVIERIKANLGVPWRQQTVDNLIAGTRETPVKGIATTMMATLAVLQRAAAAGRNMVITHESTFFSHQDNVEQLRQDETYLYKLDFIEKNAMAVFHFHDHWHARKPDGIATGMSRALGWEKFADAQNPRLFAFPGDGVPLKRLAGEIQSKLKASTVRVVGDPKLTVHTALASWGFVSQMPGIPFAARPGVDVFICGETREWELVEYVQDMIASGKKKGMIVIGHVASEQAGMELCAEWLKPLVPEVPVEFIAAPEPFWRPR